MKSSKQEKKIKEVIDSEFQKHIAKRLKDAKIKFFTATYSLQNISSSGTLGTIFYPAQGTQDAQRIGDFARMTRIKFRAKLQLPSAAPASSMVRVVLFLWNIDTTSYSPVASDILSNNNVVADYNVDSIRIKKFVPIFDETVCLTQGGYQVQSIVLDRQVNIKVGFNGASTSGTRQLFYYFVSDVGSSNYPQLQFESNIYFTDTI